MTFLIGVCGLSIKAMYMAAPIIDGNTSMLIVSISHNVLDSGVRGA